MVTVLLEKFRACPVGIEDWSQGGSSLLSEIRMHWEVGVSYGICTGSSNTNVAETRATAPLTLGS